MTGAPNSSLWVFLSSTPLFWLTATIIAWLMADRIAAVFGRHPAANPVLLSVALLGLLLRATDTPYPQYFAGAQFVHFLLGPAVVAIAVPLYKNWSIVRRMMLPMLIACTVGGSAAVLSALGIAALFGIPREVLVSLAPKSITAGVAMGIAEGLGGVPALAAVLVLLTGAVGAITVTPLMNGMRITDFAARGFAAGVAAHGIGTVRAFSVSPLAGSFAGVAMGMNAVISSILVPLLVQLLL